MSYPTRQWPGDWGNDTGAWCTEGSPLEIRLREMGVPVLADSTPDFNSSYSRMFPSRVWTLICLLGSYKHPDVSRAIALGRAGVEEAIKRLRLEQEAKS